MPVIIKSGKIITEDHALAAGNREKGKIRKIERRTGESISRGVDGHVRNGNLSAIKHDLIGVVGGVQAGKQGIVKRCGGAGLCPAYVSGAVIPVKVGGGIGIPGT